MRDGEAVSEGEAILNRIGRRDGSDQRPRCEKWEYEMAQVEEL